MKTNQNKIFMFLTAVILSVFFVAGNVYAFDNISDAVYEIMANANDDTAEGRFGRLWKMAANFTSVGVGVLYGKDDYLFLTTDASVGNYQFIQNVDFRIGFKGLAGTIDADGADGNAAGIGFMLAAIYEIPEVELFTDRYFDFEISASVTHAPNPLCFSDADQYTQYEGTVGVHVLDNRRGTILLGYRSIQIDINDASIGDISNSGPFVGYRFRF